MYIHKAIMGELLFVLIIAVGTGSTSGAHTPYDGVLHPHLVVRPIVSYHTYRWCGSSIYSY